LCEAQETGRKKKNLFLLFLKSKILTKEKIRRREVVLCAAKRRIDRKAHLFFLVTASRKRRKRYEKIKREE